MMNHDVVIIGDGGRNQLGILREFGEHGVIPYLVFAERDNAEQKRKTEVVLASKYAKRYKVFHKNIKEKHIIEFLMDSLGNADRKPVIISTCDAAVELIDRYVEQLSEKFYLTNCQGKSGGVIYYLDKYNTFKKAKDFVIKVADSYVITLPLNSDFIISEYPVPCILKPRESANGRKADIEICNDYIQLRKGLRKFEKLQYSEILLQQYLDYEYEFSIHGWIANGHVVVPGICRYLHKKIIGTNDYMFFQYIAVKNCREKNFVRKLCEFMKDGIGYEGCFVGEAFMMGDGSIYLNEMNYRTCDLSYNEIPSGHYIAVEYVADQIGEETKKYQKRGKDNFYSVLTFAVIRLALKRKLTLFRALKEIIMSSSFEYYAKGDIKPLLYKLGLPIKASKGC